MTSIRVSARIVGTPAASRSIVTSAARPATVACPRVAGRLARTRQYGPSDRAERHERDDTDGAGKQTKSFGGFRIHSSQNQDERCTSEAGERRDAWWLIAAG